MGFADIHVFPYSPREGTVAYNWKDVDHATKTARVEVLSQIKLQLKDNFANKFVGTTQSVLCERKRNGLWEGYTKEYLRVYFTGDAKVGELANVAIEQPYLDGAIGKVE